MADDGAVSVVEEGEKLKVVGQPDEEDNKQGDEEMKQAPEEESEESEAVEYIVCKPCYEK